ncbi:penicillin-binding protein 1A [Caldicoprobacter guelmensis]|uniref:transglycosylase domain-containing protein n=1 Tax=Caldicoprobacter guelmensis TaxID=1170224 RepID=UPI0019589673|nr:PBP1A family penicillin-binding protein [Caldicoprobacter guelmensis]MBM7581361.1 penicillin-binding protein 1A [Caldicoprobacter guelmensis]
MKRDNKSFDSKNESLKKSRHGIKNYFKKKAGPPNFILSVFVTTLKMFLVLFILLGFAAFGAFLGIAKGYLDATPTLDLERIENQSEASFIYDRYGNLITPYYGLENRVWASLDEIPKMLQDAVIAVEDVRFYSHSGIDFKRLVGAIINNLRNESIQGASTITQQLIKNTLLTPERSYKRKIQEAYLAIQLEQKYTKEQILEAYLNTSYFGSGNYGVKAAAQDYFGKELKDLTLRECAVLAGILRNPYYYDPRKNLYDPTRKPEITYNRTNLVLRLMYENGFITKEQYEEAKLDPTKSPEEQGFYVIETSNRNSLYPMPYFVEYVILDVRDRLMEHFGWTGDEGRQKAMKLIQEGGLKIYTTVDPEIQKAVEEAVYNYKNLPPLANAKDKVIKDNQGNEIQQPQAAAVVIDHTTGEIRAIVGGRTPPQGRFWTNRVMQPLAVGSAIKPLSVYGPFIEAGYPGGIILEDVPVPIKGLEKQWDGRGYPLNYDRKFSGLVDVRKAIQNSINVAAARIVQERVGPDYSAEKLLELGITSPHYVNEKLVTNLALGQNGINMVEMAAAYAAIANKGIYQTPVSFTKVLDKNGNEILNKDNFQIKRVVFKESTAFILTDWMETVVNSGTGSRARFSKPMHIAGKTGTLNDWKGVYFAGFTPYYTATVWIGHDLWKPLKNGVQGGHYAAPLWKAVMEPIHKNLQNRPFYDKPPEGVVRLTVCGISGKLPNGTLCDDHLVNEWFPVEAVPKEKCDVHKEVEICQYSGKLASPYCPRENVVKKSVVVLPENSLLRQLSEEELQKYLPGAFKDAVDFAMLDYNKPEDRQYFCPLHTQEWYNSQQLQESLYKQAQELINSVRAKMSDPKYKDRLSNEARTSLEKAIEALLHSFNQATIKPPKEGEPPLTQLPPFDPKPIQQNMDYLTELSRIIFESIDKEIENETPTLNQSSSFFDNNRNRHNNKRGASD